MAHVSYRVDGTEVHMNISVKTVWHAHTHVMEMPPSEQYRLHSVLSRLITLGAKELVLRTSVKSVRHMHYLNMALFDCRPMKSEFYEDEGITILKDNTAFSASTSAMLNGLDTHVKDSTVKIIVDIDMRHDGMSGTSVVLEHSRDKSIPKLTPNVFILSPSNVFMPIKDYIIVNFKILRGEQA